VDAHVPQCAIVAGLTQASGVSDVGEAFLRDFHARDPGGSARVFARGRDERGTSSYQRLAQTIAAAPDGVTVLDLACGDGYLLELLRGQLGHMARLVGVDMSPEELGAARARLGPGVDLRCERAQATTLGTGSIDVVVSHMALMLMRPLDAVLQEMHRVLRPGGMFAAVVQSERRLPGAWADFIAIARELGAAMTITLGDVRARTAGGIRDAFGAAGAWTEIGIDDFDLNLDGPWPQVEAYLFGSYVPDLIEPRLREPLRREALARIPALAGADGTVACSAGMRLLQFRRAGADHAAHAMMPRT
jgi:SAM-dependent methyltransferase